MGCHSFKYSRWERVANDIGIPNQLMLDNMVFTGQKIGELMNIAMPADSAKEWFGATPPDLTLVAQIAQARVGIHLSAALLRRPKPPSGC